MGAVTEEKKPCGCWGSWSCDAHYPERAIAEKPKTADLKPLVIGRVVGK